MCCSLYSLLSIPMYIIFYSLLPQAWMPNGLLHYTPMGDFVTIVFKSGALGVSGALPSVAVHWVVVAQ